MLKYVCVFCVRVIVRVWLSGYMNVCVCMRVCVSTGLLLYVSVSERDCACAVDRWVCECV